MSAPNLWLKLKTRQLIKACGGLEEASRVCEADCRKYSVSHLGRCQNANEPDFLPIDIVDCLEAYCGRRIVSGAMAESRPASIAAGEFRDELSDVVEVGAALIGRYRALSADGLDAADRAELRSGFDALKEEMRQVEASLDAMSGAGR